MVDYLSQIVNFVAIFGILAVAMNIVMGYGGILTLAHGAFFGVGAYGAALVATRLYLPFPVDLVTAFVISGLTAFIIVKPLIRLNEEYVIIATIALQLIFSNVFLNWIPVTGGSYGIYGIPRPIILNRPIVSLAEYAIVSVLVLIIIVAILWLLLRSPLGLALKGQREDTKLAQSLGIDVSRLKVLAFVTGSSFAGVAGGLYARFIGYIEPTTFGFSQSLMALTIVIIGGAGNLWGSLAGAAVLISVPQVLRFIPATNTLVAQLQLIIYGLLLIGVIRFRPQGLIPERPLLGATSNEISDQTVSLEEIINDASSSQRNAFGEHDLEVSGLSKAFGGLVAVQDLSLNIPAKRISAILGPNGAGKTTAFNLISGYLSPDSGSVTYAGHELVGLQPHEIARRGITRSFQDVRVFTEMTVLENMALTLQDPTKDEILHNFRMSFLKVYQNNIKMEALRYITAFGLGELSNQRVGEISYAQQKMLVVAGIVARGTPLIMLDELAAGLDETSVDKFAQLLRKFSKMGHTICLVEHNLDFVWKTADIVFVLDEGSLVALGTPEEIKNNRQVAEIYFGTGEAVV